MRSAYQLLSFVYGQPWHILPTRLLEIEAAVWKDIRRGRVAGGRRRQEAKAAANSGPDASKGYQVVGAAGIVPIQGVIVSRDSWYSWYFGGCSAEGVARSVELAAADPQISGIVLDCNTPGGSVFGMPEASAKIFEARKAKAVVAVANHVAASCGYYFASQANTIAVTPNGTLGAIGTIISRFDDSKREEMLGIKTNLITNAKSPFKSEGYSEVPFSDAEREDLQKQVDFYGNDFIAAVAKGRGVRASVVEKTYGQGRMKLADEAVALGMADRIATLADVVNEINGVRTKALRRRVAADLARLGLPT